MLRETDIYDSYSVVSASAILASLGNSLKIQIIGVYLRHT